MEEQRCSDAPGVPTLAELQCTKTQLEIRDLRRWWARPAALASFATILITMLAFVTALRVGYFDKARLDFEKATILANLDSLKVQKDEGERRVAELQKREEILIASIRDLNAEKTSLEQTLDRTVSDSNMSVRNLDEANRQLRQQLQDAYTRIKKTDDEVGALRKALSDLQRDKNNSDATSTELRGQLSLYPPLIQRSKITSENDLNVSGELNGANLGARPGSLEIRALAMTSTQTRRSRTSEGSQAALAPFAISAESITKWTPSFVRFDLRPAERNRFMEMIRLAFPEARNYGWNDLIMSVKARYEARIRTTDETRTEWTPMTPSLSFSTGPVTVGAPPD